jgi:biopolymer transport protein ExbD
MKTKQWMKKPEKLNLVPILDSVFIFIFFLLMSAQFVDVYEIGSSLPMTQKITEKNEKDPLNLVMEVTKDTLVIKTGVKKETSKNFEISQVENLRKYLGELKRANPKENTIIVKAEPKLPFQTLIKAIDATRSPAGNKEKLFEQIVFDNKGGE